MSYCPKCGTQIPESANSCPKCGFSIANAEADYDFNYYEKKRKRKIEENEKVLSNANTQLVIFSILLIVCLFSCNGGFFKIVLCGFGTLISITLLIIAAGAKSEASKKIKKWSNLTAHDLYIDEKKDAQTMANLANGLKAVNTGMKIGQFLGGL